MDIKHQPEVEGKEYICLNLTGVNGGPLLVENEKYNFKVYNKPNRLTAQPDGDTPAEPDTNVTPSEQ